MKKWLKCLLVIAILTITIGAFVGYSLLKDSEKVSSTGKVKAVGISLFEDPTLTTPLISIDWGTMEPNETKTYDFYVLNDGNASVNLTMLVDNWNPTNASDYISVSYNYLGQVIDPDQSLGLTFSLTLYQNITGIEAFSFDITVSGEG